MKLIITDDQGTPASPSYAFDFDTDAGAFIKNKRGDVGYAIDGVEVSRNEFLDHLVVTGVMTHQLRILVRLMLEDAERSR